MALLPALNSTIFNLFTSSFSLFFRVNLKKKFFFTDFQPIMKSERIIKSVTYENHFSKKTNLHFFFNYFQTI